MILVKLLQESNYFGSRISINSLFFRMSKRITNNNSMLTSIFSDGKPIAITLFSIMSTIVRSYAW